MKTKNILQISLLTLASLASYSASAAPINLVASGTVIDAYGSRASDLNTAFSTNITFDLDGANAYAFEIISPAGEPPFPRWTFDSSPYEASFSGNFGSFSTGIVMVETIDNFDADANGNPFGLTGLIDALSIFGSSIVVDCSNGTVDPVTGCSDPNAPWDYGQEIGINLIDNGSWFSGDVLPDTIPDISALLGVYGSGVDWLGGAEVGDFIVDYDTMTVSAVPVPTAVWLFGSGLLGLVGIARRKKA
jgi:hypothetical protein